MEILILIILCFIGFVFLKTRVFSTEEEKCFRRIWSMNKISNFAEHDATYARLYKEFDINFSHKVESKSLIKLIGAAHHFDATKNQNSLGVHVGPIVEREVYEQMKLAGKSDQFDELQTNMLSIGDDFLSAIAKEMDK